MTLDLISVIKK